jgi:RluA family pseudouridine synthase
MHSQLSIVNIAAYKFASLANLPALRDELRELCRQLSLRGTILLSEEGINLFVAGRRQATDALVSRLRVLPTCGDLEVKESFSDHQPFNRMLVKIKREIIAFGVDGIDPRRYTSSRMSPQTLRAWLDEGREVTLLDVRNEFEVNAGTFTGASSVGIEKFRDFPNAAARLPDELKQHPIVTFCTGGIRCEKAAPMLERMGFEQVYQLDGGILKYLQECGDAHFDGVCFVFDRRVAVNGELAETATAQCFVCQTTLTAEDQQSSAYVEGESCPRCYRAPEVLQSELLAGRQTELRRIVEPLPGSVPYDNFRPISVPARCNGFTVLDFLDAMWTHLSRTQWQAICDAGELFDRGNPVAATDVVRGGQRFLHKMPATREPDVASDIRIVYEDDALIVVDKPAPLPMHPCGRFNRNTLSWILRELYGPTQPRPAHRLDANTSGLVVLCKNRRVSRPVHAQFAAGSVRKSYLARIQGEPTSDVFSSSLPISAEPGALGIRVGDSEGQVAHTEFRVRRRNGDGTTLVEVNPRTGRTNQIRIHLWDLGLPICGDPSYLADHQLGNTQTRSLLDPPMCLHAHQIELRHPVSEDLQCFVSEPPGWSV